jgi:hypothetical protein
MRAAPAVTAALLCLALPMTAQAAVAPAGPEITLSLQTTTQPANPQVTFFSTGGYVVAWTVRPPNGGPTALHARIFDGQGGSTGEFRLVKPANQRLDGVATIAGGFVAVWDQTNGHGITSVWARRFDSAGMPLTGPFKVHGDAPLSRYGGRVAGAPDGGFAVAWAADAAPATDPAFHTDAFARLFAATGQPGTGEFPLTYGSATDHSQVFPSALAVAPDGTLAVVSQFAGAAVLLVLQRFAANGALLAALDPFPSGSCCTGEQFAPALAMGSDGGFVVAWATNGTNLPPNPPLRSQILMRRFAADGTTLGSDVTRVNFRGRFENDPHLAVLSDGGFAAVWTDFNGRDGSGLGIFGRTFAADGSAVRPDYRINLTTSGDQHASAFAISPGGKGLALWVEPPASNSLPGVIGRFLE